MSRKSFMFIAGLMAMVFGGGMLAAPDQMLANMAQDSEGARHVLQWMGCMLLGLGFINIGARHDPGSIALRAVMLGNIVLHVLGFGIDVYHNSLGFVQTSGVIAGAVVHGGLVAGFVYFYSKLER